jgi:hypothetical protein
MGTTGAGQHQQGWTALEPAKRMVAGLPPPLVRGWGLIRLGGANPGLLTAWRAAPLAAGFWARSTRFLAPVNRSI